MSKVSFNIDKEISKLNPSQDVINFYKKKIQKYYFESEDNIKLFNSYKNLVSPVIIAKERVQILQDNLELREALSDVNVFIHAERQQVAKLHLEKEILKVEAKVAAKKIDLLLQLAGISEQQLQSYLTTGKKIERSSSSTKNAVPIYELRHPDDLICKHDKESYKAELLTQKKLDTYVEHLASTEKAWIEEKAILLEDRTIKTAEAKAQFQENEACVKLLSYQLEEAQKLTHDSIAKLIKARSDEKRNQLHWLTEKESLLKEIEKLKHSNTLYDCFDSLEKVSSYTDIRHATYNNCEARHMKKEFYSLKKKLIDAEGLKDLYEKKCNKFEQTTCQLKEQREEEQKLFHDKLNKLYETKELHKKQRDKLEKRLKLQSEGFNNERNIMKQHIKSILHQLYKLISIVSRCCQISDSNVASYLMEVTSLTKNIIAEIKKVCYEGSPTKELNHQASES